MPEDTTHRNVRRYDREMDNVDSIPAIRGTRARYSGLLMQWSAGSVLLAIAMFIAMTYQEIAARRAILGAVAAQFLIWGLIDAVFAFAGLRQARRADAGAFAPADELRDAQNFLRTLAFSMNLNWIWLTIGAVLIGAGIIFNSAPPVGHGIGVLIQAGFLAVFDFSFLRAMRAVVP